MTNISFSHVENFPLSLFFMREVGENKESLLRLEFASVDLMKNLFGRQNVCTVTGSTCIFLLPVHKS